MDGYVKFLVAVLLTVLTVMSVVVCFELCKSALDEFKRKGVDNRKP